MPYLPLYHPPNTPPVTAPTTTYTSPSHLFAIPPILRSILSHLDPIDTFRAQRINKLCRDILREEEYDGQLFRVRQGQETTVSVTPTIGFKVHPILQRDHMIIRRNNIQILEHLRDHKVLNDYAIYPPTERILLGLEDKVWISHEEGIRVKDVTQYSRWYWGSEYFQGRYKKKGMKKGRIRWTLEGDTLDLDVVDGKPWPEKYRIVHTDTKVEAFARRHPILWNILSILIFSGIAASLEKTYIRSLVFSFCWWCFMEVIWDRVCVGMSVGARVALVRMGLGGLGVVWALVGLRVLLLGWFA